MSNDLIELTNTELDAVSGGKHGLLALNFGNILTNVNTAENSAAIVNMGNSGNNTISQSITQSGSNGPVSGPSFSGFTFSL
jgi:hypothetical protein